MIELDRTVADDRRAAVRDSAATANKGSIVGDYAVVECQCS